MRNFLRRIKIAWLFTKHFPFTPIPDDYWLMENAKELTNFLMSDTGTKFRFLMRNKVSDSAMRAIIDSSDHSKHLCGYASGVRGTIAEIDELGPFMANTREGFGMDEEEAKELAERSNLT